MELETNNTTTTKLNDANLEYSVGSQALDQANTNKETYWDNTNFNLYMGHYKDIPSLKMAIESMATWVVGKGYTPLDKMTKREIENVRGWGNEDFITIMDNHERMTMVNGDAFTEIIRKDNGDLLNLKPLTPSNIRTVTNSKGRIIRYEELRNGKPFRKIQPKDMLHSSESRIGSEIHGNSKVAAVMWVIEAKQEVMHDLRRIMHRSTIRVLYVNMDDEDRIKTLREQYKEGIKEGEVLILPAKRENAEFEDLTVPAVTAFMEWIRHLDNEFYRTIGVPEIILGGSQNYTEASSKIGYLTFEQPYMARQRKLEADLKNQVALNIKFNRPVSLKDDVQKGEDRNTGQTNIQQNESSVGVARSE